MSDAASILSVAYEHAANNRPIAATDFLAAAIDDCLAADKFDVVTSIMDEANVGILPQQTLTGMLVVTKHVKGWIGESRARFFARVMETLRERETPQKVIDSIKRRLE